MAPGATTCHLGLDLGGTNVKWAVVEHADHVWSRRDSGQVSTKVGATPETTVTQLADIGARAIAAWPSVATVGIGVPGLYDPVAGTTRFLVNVPGAWAGFPVTGPVSDALALPAYLVNDARAFTIAELRLGAGRGVEAMIGLTLGTGVGGGIAIDGVVRQGHDGTAGEIGHQTIEPDGPLCNCGNRGCLEAFARADQIVAVCGTTTVEEAVEAARAGDPRATAGLAEIGRYLGIGIANMITVLTPDRVVIGGGVAGAGDLLFVPIRAELRRHVFTTAVDEVEIVTAELGTMAGAIGAAVYGAERDRWVRAT